MSIINRSTKVGSGTTEFVPNTTILSGEVNTDFDTIYADYDGNITNDNIAASAGIVYGKLNLSNSIVNADINTTAGIVGTKIANAPMGIDTAQINDGAITTPKLAIGATVRGHDGAFFTPTTISGSTAESAALITVNHTSGGGLCLIMLAWVARATYPAAGASMTMRLKRDGTTIYQQDFIGLDVDGNGTFVYLPSPTFIDQPTAGVHAYTVTIQPGDATQTFTCAADGNLNLVEFA